MNGVGEMPARKLDRYTGPVLNFHILDSPYLQILFTSIFRTNLEKEKN